jgi:hypothetical protein
MLDTNFFNKKIIENLSSSSFIFENSKQQIIVSFYSFNEKLIYENNYSSDKLLEDVIEDFINNEKIREKLIKLLDITESINVRNINFFFKNKEQYEKIKDKKISLSLRHSGKSFSDSYLSTSDIQINKFKIYVKYEIKRIKFRIPNNIEQYIINKTYLIGRPILNQNDYYLYNKYNNDFKQIRCPSEYKRILNLKPFLVTNAYCNALNNLYIYEGKFDLPSSSNSKLIRINLINKEITIISSTFPNRILHSMIFIPECYVFIVGGKNVKENIIYEIHANNRNYDIYPKLLPYEILEPSLICINNKYLYAFENSTLNFHILRTDLINVTDFEDIKIKNNKYDINQKFFGVVKDRNSIIFFGGQMLNLFNNQSNKCFAYDYNDDTIERCQKDYIAFEFLEKTFIPLESGKYIQLIEIKNENQYKPKKLIFKAN